MQVATKWQPKSLLTLFIVGHHCKYHLRFVLTLPQLLIYITCNAGAMSLSAMWQTDNEWWTMDDICHCYVFYDPTVSTPSHIHPNLPCWDTGWQWNDHVEWGGHATRTQDDYNPTRTSDNEMEQHHNQEMGERATRTWHNNVTRIQDDEVMTTQGTTMQDNNGWRSSQDNNGQGPSNDDGQEAGAMSLSAMWQWTMDEGQPQQWTNDNDYKWRMMTLHVIGCATSSRWWGCMSLLLSIIIQVKYMSTLSLLFLHEK